MFGFICCCCRSRVVVQYVGTPNCPISAPDGNSYSNKPFVRTNPSLLAKVKEVMQVTAGHAAPAKVYKEVIRNQDVLDPRTYPRNLKQVYTPLSYYPLSAYNVEGLQALSLVL